MQEGFGNMDYSKNEQMEDFEFLFPDNRHTGASTLRQAQLVMLRMLKVVDYICEKHQINYWLCAGTLLGAVRHQGFIPWDDDLDIAMLREDYERFLTVAKQELPPDLFLQTKENEPAYDNLTLPCKIRDTKSLIISPYLEKKQYHKGLFVDIFPFDRFHRTGFQRWKEVLLKKYNNILNKCFDAEMGKDTSSFKTIVSWFRPFFKWMLVQYHHIVAPVIARNRALTNEKCYVGHGFDVPWLRSYRMDDIFPLQKLIFEDAKFWAPCNTDAYLKQFYGDTYMTPPPEDKRIQAHSTTIKPIL